MLLKTGSYVWYCMEVLHMLQLVDFIEYSSSFEISLVWLNTRQEVNILGFMEYQLLFIQYS